MQRILVCTGVLGGGTAIVFALAAATATLFPQGTVVSSGWNGNNTVMFGKPVNAFARGPVMIDDVMVAPPAVEVPALPVPEPVR